MFNNWLSGGKKKLQLVAVVDFCGESNPTKAVFKLPLGHH